MRHLSSMRFMNIIELGLLDIPLYSISCGDFHPEF